MNNIQKIKQYIQIVEPKKSVFIFSLIAFLARYLLDLYLAIPSANAITSITIGDVHSTIKWLIVVCVVICIQQVLSFIIDRLFYKTIETCWQSVYSKIYDKISAASNESFLETSKQKIINTAYNNMSVVGEFPHYVAKYVSYFIQAFVTIIILVKNNVLIGAAIVLVCVLLYFILNKLNKKKSFWQNKQYSEQDKAAEILSDLYNNQLLTNDLNLTNNFRKRYISHVSKGQDYLYKHGMYLSGTENWIPFAYNAIICALSIYLVILTKSSVFTLTLYLILTKYLSQAIKQMTSSYGLLSQIHATHVGTLRVKNILDMTTEDLIEFGNNQTDNLDGQVMFTNCSYSSDAPGAVCPIKKFNLCIPTHSSTLIYGSHKCGKRAIYSMLNRSIKPVTGTITIDNINIYDFSKDIYKHNIATVTNNEYFYNDSIMNNLLLSGASKTQIYKTCKDFGIHNKIVSMQNSYNTNLSKENTNFSSVDMFILGLARAYCSNAEVLVIYGFPTGMSAEQKQNLEQILQFISIEKTLISFSHNDWAKNIYKNVYKVEKGQISKQ